LSLEQNTLVLAQEKLAGIAQEVGKSIDDALDTLTDGLD
jgi:hypothetical protein